MIKDIIKNLKPSSTLLINEKSNKLENEGKKIFKFGFGQSPFKIPQKIVDELKNNAHQNKYLPMQGLQDLRVSIANNISKKKGYEYLSSNIIIGPGSKELMFLLQILFDGEIILPAPSWVSYAPQAIIGRNKIKWIETKSHNNWFPTAKEIEDIIKEDKQKKYLIFLNSPNNPSGQVCTNLDEISKLVKKYNLIFLSDEIYSELTFEDNYKSISNYCPQNTIISTGLSKWCGAGGWRVGFFAVPNKLSNFLGSIKTLASESYSTVNSPAQYAAVEAYEGNYDDYIARATNILKSVGNYVYTNLKSNKILINPPQGGFYLMPEFKNKKYKTSSKLCEAILNDTGVAMLPGSDFGFSPKKMLTRLSYTDFDGVEFFKNVTNCKMIDDEMIKKYAPNVVEGINKLSNWAKNL